LEATQFVAKQLERPAVAALWWSAAAKGNQVCFCNTVQLARGRWPRPALQRDVTLACKPLADPDNLPLGQTDGRGNLMVRSASFRLPIVSQK
jgi:hypothetical protein